MGTQLLEFVHPLQGTDSREDFSRGNTLPLLCTPFPMTAWTLQTDEGRWAFRWRDAKIQGVRATHQPSPWMGDHGHFTVMPQQGELLPAPQERGSSYDKEALVCRPDYFRVHLLRDDCVLEATPTERGVKLRLRFGKAGPTRLIIDGFRQGGSLEWDAVRRIVLGSSRANYGGTPENFAQWFAIRLHAAATGLHQARPAAPEEILGALDFTAEAGQTVECDIATSYISAAQAVRNLDAEIGGRTFESIRNQAAAAWEERLAKIQVESTDARLKKVFYSCLYRTLTFPHKCHETDAEGQTVHYSPYDGAVHPGELYTGHGFWDTYRTAYPLYALLCPEDYASFLRGWMNACREGGWYPRWPSPGYRTCMLSTHVDAVFADAAGKGITGFDLAEAYEGLRRHAFENLEEDAGFGRPGLGAYLALGYIPADRYRHSVAATLDNAYCDFCLAQIARMLGRTDDEEVLLERALSYRQMFDSSVGFMRGRNADGSWLEPFDEFFWGGPYVEGSAWQTSWGVPHDVPGLITLFGGPEKFVAKLDQMLATPPHFTVGDYGFEIHEMSEMACAKFGQYAHSNQPVHHALYLFAEAGAPEKTDHWVGKILTESYDETPGGFPGDEDNGEMSAWFILSALGLFPLCPGKPEYVLAKPLFNAATVHLPSGPLRIVRPDEGSSDRAFFLDGKELPARRVSHAELLAARSLAYGEKTPSAKGEHLPASAVDISRLAAK
ncbi:MAG TPA: GH92 family glycosyl hydrolase [Terrimicrobiaceae bacterium]|nr:GH92 family glycosyl hydrolase [Terrimicrobiaceae bacterium]